MVDFTKSTPDNNVLFLSTHSHKIACVEFKAMWCYLIDLILSCFLTGFDELMRILSLQVLAEVLSRVVEENKQQVDEERPETVWLQCLKCQAEFYQPATESDNSLSHLDELRNDSKDMALKIKKSIFFFFFMSKAFDG